MQTTLRIRDDLYREAKAEAAREGITLTRFLEEGLRMRLEKKVPLAAGQPYTFPVFNPGVADMRDWDEIKRLAEDDELDHYRAALGLEGDKP